MPKYTIDLSKIELDDSELVSKTITNLTHLRISGVYTPQGFVVTFQAFDEIVSPLLPKLETLLQTLNSVEQATLFKKLSHDLREQIDFDKNFKDEISTQIKKLHGPYKIKSILVNSSERETVSSDTTIEGRTQVFEAIKSAFLSFLNKDLVYKEKKITQIKTAVLVTEKISPDISGKAFTQAENNVIEIQSIWGESNPLQNSDIAITDRQTSEEKSYKITPQKFQIIFKKGKYQRLEVSEKFQNQRKINPDLIGKISKTIVKLQSKVLVDLEMDFEIEDNKIFLTDISLNKRSHLSQETLTTWTVELPTIAQVKTMFPGIAIGVSKIINKQKDLKKLKTGDIAIISSLNKSYIPKLKKASGIVINSSRELSKDLLPKIQNLGVTTLLGNVKNFQSQVITLNGRNGKILRGSISALSSKKLDYEPTQIPTTKIRKTATKVFCEYTYGGKIEFNVDELDGFGPIKPEAFIRRAGIHPTEFFLRSSSVSLLGDIRENLERITSFVDDNPVIYQISDFKSNELIHLNFGEKHEKPETNPAIGHRGAERHLAHPQLIEKELTMIKNLRNKNGLKNIWISLPFIRTLDEFVAMKSIVSRVGLNRSPSFKLLVTISTPANAFQIEEFIKQGIDGVLIDFYELVNLTYGKDFSYQEISFLEDEAIEELIKSILLPVKKAKLFSGIFNLPDSNNQRLIKLLVKLGIKSISTTAARISETKGLIYEAEKDLVK